MATATERHATNGREATGGLAPARTQARLSGRRRQLPLVVVGVLLVVGFALAFADASLRLGARQEVLVLSRPIMPGQVLTGADLREARVSVGSGLQVVAAADEASVLGRPAAVPLAAGSPLSASEVGTASPVGSGFDVVAVGLKAGAFPPALVPGDRVQVVPVTAATSGTAGTGSGGGGSTAGSPVAATVVGVAAAQAASGSPTVFSLEVRKGDASEVAELAAAGQASLVQLGAGS